MAPRLAIVVPCYNESEVLPLTLKTVVDCVGRLVLAGKISDDSFVLFVDDGSNDGSWSAICKYHDAEPTRIKAIKLSRNAGHQKALLAGLHNVREKADCAITIDADLQDDTRAIESMIDAYRVGAEVVYGVRTHRAGDTRFKRWTALRFYNLMTWLGINIVENHADFRLLGSRALECLTLFQESNLFLRGIVPLIGFRTEQVKYDRQPRAAGETKYPLHKMLSFAWDGITSFSPAPLRLISLVGGALFIMSAAAATSSMVAYFLGHTVVGWTSLAIAVFMLGGMQLLAIGIIGEYVAKIYIETKRRPIYIVERELK